MTNASLEARVRGEIEGLHRFLVEWISGAVPASDEVFDARILSHLDENLCVIPPAGTVLTRSALAAGIRAGYGSNPGFRIAIRNVQVRMVLGDYVVATYEEWQRNALVSTPPDNGRVASVLLRSGTPLQWLHLHETWLPKAVMEAGPYDF